MFALGLRYLNGWSMAAADGARKQQAEWPPHPDRVFMALAAAWFDTGEDVDEGAALRWLEGLEAPAILASEATQRSPVVSYVPVNDDPAPISRDSNKKQWKQRPQGSIPIGRNRQPRGFPTAVPHDPTVLLIWSEPLSTHAAGLERLATKVTHVGHSASFVQAWIEKDGETPPNLIPTTGVAELRLRIPSTGRLEQLAQPHREAFQSYRSHLDQIEREEADLADMSRPPRVAWRRDFPDVLILAEERQTRTHPEYAAAKSGDSLAARRLVESLVDNAKLAAVHRLIHDESTALPPALVAAHAYEADGVNAIPATLAEWLGARLGTSFVAEIVQSNVVSHTGADGYGRLARQARFEGRVEAGGRYVLVDDFVGQGGTLANLRGWVEKLGGVVIGAVALTGKPYSAKLAITEDQLHELRNRHGRDFEKWWRSRFGHAFNCLTQSEARYLARSPGPDTIRDRLAAAKRDGDRPSYPRSARKQRSFIASLRAHRPATPRRPLPGRWQGYAHASTAQAEGPPPSTVFDPLIVVLGIVGRRLTLHSTLKLTAALRGLLMRECPEQPPPPWFSGHDAGGRPTSAPHLALAPLPFVGAGHADGRIMGLAVILPLDLVPEYAARALNPVLHDAETGLPREHRLFDSRSFECAVTLDTREQPPTNLDRRTWTAASRTWASVTPVALNRHFDGADRWDRAAENLQDACEHIGLPRPCEVVLQPVSMVEGVPHAREFPPLTRKSDGSRRVHTHALFVFDEPVSGPVLVGAGRFRGYGLCRPMDRR